MRWIKRILIGLVTIVVAFCVISLFLPRVVEVKRSASINAVASEIFPHVNSLKATSAWSPWLEIDPEVKTNFTGPDAGVGAAMTWTSDHPNVGSGSQEIIASVENERVDTALDFGSQGTATATFLLEPNGSVTQVTWGFVTDTGYNPIARYFGAMLDSWVGADYEKGLARLKALVEG